MTTRQMHAQLERLARGVLRCNLCGEELPVISFHRRSSNRTGYYTTCIRCAYDTKAARHYGITVEEYRALTQGTCSICGGPAKYLDHCHATGRIRGGLCNPCNLALGHMKDDPARLRAAADYLERTHG